MVEDEPELLRFLAFYDRWREGVLAYFDRRETIAAVEGLNNKDRVDASQLRPQIGRQSVAAFSAGTEVRG